MFLQHKCFDFSPLEGAHGRLWQALVCGRDLESVDFWSSTLKISGLVHIFIVSGAHFLVIKFILERLHVPKILANSLLWFFNIISGLTAPGTRACLQVTTRGLFKLQHHQNIFVSSLLCLCLNPIWIKSHSFWLSWLASLILTISPKDPLRVMANSLFFSAWSLLGFPLSLWSLILNILVAPLIGWLLFPLALLALIPSFDFFFAKCLEALEFLLRTLELSPPSNRFRLHAISEISFIVLSTHTFIQIHNLSSKGRKLK